MHRRALLRASDQDREQVAQRLRTAVLEGRLTNDELDERLGLAYASRTYGELDELVADLPLPPLPATGIGAAVTARTRSRPLARLAGGTAFVAVLSVLALLARSGGVLWAHAAHAAGGATIVQAFGVFAAARAVGVAVAGLTFLLVLVAAVGWVLSRPWAAGGA